MTHTKFIKQALFVSALGLSTNALSADGTVTITGTIYTTACTITTPSISVYVPTSFETDYTAAGVSGTPSDASEGALALTNCPADDMSIAVNVIGDADATDTSLFKVSPGTATGIGLKLTFDGVDVTPGSFTSSYYTVEDLGGTNGYGWTKYFQVTPVATSSTVKAGSLETSLTYTLAYQ